MRIVDWQLEKKTIFHSTLCIRHSAILSPFAKLRTLGMLTASAEQ
jgi:hypothetical protein